MVPAMPDVRELDLSGLKCPLPALRTRKALRGAEAGTVMRVITTDPMAALDIPNLLRETGDRLEAQTSEPGRLTFTIVKAG